MSIRPFASSAILASIMTLILTLPSAAKPPSDWKKADADIRLKNGLCIKAIYHPADKAPRMMRDRCGSGQITRRFLHPLGHKNAQAAVQTSPIFMNQVDSPPLDGFIPWVAVTVTNARSDDLDFAGYEEPAVTGSYLTLSPQTNYAIGIFDTGASSSLIGYAEAVRTGIYASGLVTDSIVTLMGATGTVDALASYPLGIFIDGLGAVEPNGLLQQTSGMRGESNVSIIVGPPPAGPDLPTAIGAPFAVFHALSFDNEHKVTIIRDANEYRGPAIALYDLDDPAIPDYNDSIPLQLRPSGAPGVNYWPTFDYGTLDFYPLLPSVAGDFFLVPQTLFFVATVHLADGGYIASDQTKFMLDTGAQVSVIDTVVATRLGLKRANRDFEVEIQDVTGDITVYPGFYIDSLQIPAADEWLTATNVPVVWIDIASPEGGYLEGIIGMNLFTGFNMVFRGGGMVGQDPPSLDFKLITNIADIAPTGGDGKVDGLDLGRLCAAWLSQPGQGPWDELADIAPEGGDDVINFKDFATLAASWDWLRGQ